MQELVHQEQNEVGFRDEDLDADSSPRAGELAVAASLLTPLNDQFLILAFGPDCEGFI